MADGETQLRYAVLGPVCAYRCGGEVDVGPAKQRAVLAMLLLRANRPVSRDDIIDGVWGERVPSSAANLVATYVAGLRRAIDPARAHRSGGTVLASTLAGYILRLPTGQLDLDVFGELLARAHGATGRESATALDDALALWRGQPLDGLPGPFAAAERQRLAERRLAVLEERIETGLALGEHADWVAELTGLVARYPYRERMRALHMLALYRVGRRADALGVFDDARATLADNLGIEPGAELRALHRRILTADPALDVAAARPPAQLPADLADFTGRAAEVAAVGGWLGTAPTGPPALVVVTGPAGIGKTSLALHAAHLARARFPDGQLHVDLRGTGPRPLPADEVLARLLTDLGVEPARIPALPDRRAAMFRTLLAGRRLLVVLDDAADAAQVQPLLPGSGGCAVLVTSRTRLAHLAGARVVTLDALPAGAALALLARIAGAGRVAAEPAPAAEVVALCAGLPLAVRIAGVRLASRPAWTVGTLADRLRSARRRLSELRAGSLAVRGSFQVSYAALADGLGARLFRLLGLLDAVEVTVPAAAALAGCPLDDAERALEQLVDAHLLESPAPDRYRMRPLLHLFARELAAEHDCAADRSGALDRVARHYLAGVRGADRLLRPTRLAPAEGTVHFGTRVEALAWLERERAAIVGAGLRAAATPGVDPMLSAALVTDLRAFMHRRGYWDEQRRLASAAAAAARRDGHDHASALALVELGATAYLRRRLGVADAYLRRSVALFRRLSDPLGLSLALNNLSLVCVERSRLDEAAALAREDLAVRRRLGDRFGESVALDTLALVEVRRGCYADAVGHCARSIALYRAAGARALSYAPLNLLGLALAGLGRPDRAAWCLRRSSQLARHGGNRYWQARALADLAAAYRSAGWPRHAVASGRRARLIYDRLGDRHGSALAQRRVAGALADLRVRAPSPAASAGSRRRSPSTG